LEVVLDNKLEVQFADQISVFNNISVSSAINWLIANGYQLGQIITVILVNLQEIIAVVKAGNPMEILALLVRLLGSPTTKPDPPAMIG
jgi:hypothetical protein